MSAGHRARRESQRRRTPARTALRSVSEAIAFSVAVVRTAYRQPTPHRSCIAAPGRIRPAHRQAAERCRRIRRSGRETPEIDSAAEQSLEPAEETAAALTGRSRCGPAGCRLGSRCRTGADRRFGSGSGGGRRRGSSGGRHARSGCCLHLLVVAAQDGIRRHQAGCLLHLLVVAAQNRICRCCAHNRLLGGRRVGHCNEIVLTIIRIPESVPMAANAGSKWRSPAPFGTTPTLRPPRGQCPRSSQAPSPAAEFARAR